MRSSKKQTKVIEKIHQLFNQASIENLARTTGFVERSSPLSGFNFMLLCVFAEFSTCTFSLNQLCIKLMGYGTQMCVQSLNERFNMQAVTFIKTLCEQVLMMKLNINETIDQLVHFGRIIIKDSTVWQLPESYKGCYKGNGGGASEAGIKVHYSYDLKGTDSVSVQLIESASPDTKAKLEKVQPNDLIIRDLGYFELPQFSLIDEQGAFFLSRYRYGIKVYTMQEDVYKEVDVDELVSKMPVGQIVELNAYLGCKEKLPVRLILEKLPPEIGAGKRRKMKNDKQNKRKNVTQGRLNFCDVNAYITNVPQQYLSADLTRSLYALRWQIEIIFKAWKSIYGIDKVKKVKIKRFECFNYGRLILILLSAKLFNCFKVQFWNEFGKELSELKSFQLFRQMTQQLVIAIIAGKDKIGEFLDYMGQILAQRCCKDKRKHRVTPMQIFNQISLT